MLTSSDGRTFTVVVAMDDTPTNTGDNDWYDWGFAPIPSKGLTTELVCGWGPGDNGVPPANNGSPAWVVDRTAGGAPIYTFTPDGRDQPLYAEFLSVGIFLLRDPVAVDQETVPLP